MPTKPIVFTSVGLLLMIIFICIFIIKNDKPKDIKYLYKPCDETIKLENIFFEPFAPSQEQEFAVMYINEKYIPCEGHVYSFDDEFYVYASYKSKVVSVEPYTAFDNTYTVILEYENLQFTYNCLQEPSVEEGQTLKTGQKVGIAQKINMNHKEFYGLYYIIKVHNRLVNPTVAFKTKINDLLDETYGF